MRKLNYIFLLSLMMFSYVLCWCDRAEGAERILFIAHDNRPISMQQTAERYLLQRKEAVAVLAQRTASLSPSQVLARGYSVIMDGHKPVVSIRDLGEEADICFIDGTAHVKIMKRKEGNAFERFADREPGVV